MIHIYLSSSCGLTWAVRLDTATRLDTLPVGVGVAIFAVTNMVQHAAPDAERPLCVADSTTQVVGLKYISKICVNSQIFRSSNIPK